MSDLIDRQAAIDAMAELQGSTSSKGVLIGISKAWKRIKQLPPIQPKRGRWIDGYCSECGAHAPFWAMASTYHKSNFCPNCGADMRGKQDDSV